MNMNSEIAVGIVLKDSHVLIVKRKQGEGNLQWQFPGGVIENGETDLQAVIREITEETGCEVDVVKLLGQRLHPYTKKTISYWICQYKSGTLSIYDDDLEDVKWINKDELLNYFTTSVYEPVLKYLDLMNSY